MKARHILMTLAACAGSAGVANAAEILVTTNISVSTTWFATDTYNLQDQIYVLPGATLTIEAGTIIASDTGLGGSLAVCKGAQIFINGTVDLPVIMTSKADVATWTGGDPKTGTWRAACNEWGNLTVMGDGYISENIIGTNTPAPNAGNYAPMEGLVAGFPGDTKVLYGGGDDDDDSGSITYLSLRYGGKVIGLNNELNGLSLGGIGRTTVIHHIDIMNNVDDGVEIWGGTVNLKYVNIWNIGDDSFDIDQGWRGKAQFGLIVQGYSVNAARGSGVGDNCFETDGAEDSDWQPVTTTSIYNFTSIGQPLSGRRGAAYRDGARVQYHNSIFMDLGLELVRNDNLDGDGAHGYGFGGTLTFAQTWSTPYNAVPAHANDPGSPATFYQAQSSGMLSEMTDCLFFRNLNGAAYTEATAQGVFAGGNNATIPGSLDADMPIVSITRGAAVPVVGGLTVLPVIGLDPRPKNAAVTSVGMAPNDGFFTPAQYVGAFSPTEQSWLCGWTASNAFGYTTTCDPIYSIVCEPGTGGVLACPCGNPPAGAGQGCNNKANTGGASIFSTAGYNLLSTPTLQLTTSGENPTVFSIMLQGSVLTTGTNFGHGVRCMTSFKRMYSRTCAAGSITFPNFGLGDQDIPTRAAALLAPIPAGATRWYQVYYRDTTNLLPGPPAQCGVNATQFNITPSAQVTRLP